jgi:uncharacterized protein (TIGR00251 family)
VGSAVIDIRVIPRARRNAVDGMRAGAFLVRLAAPPVDGAANDALLAFLADVLDVPPRNITIVSGGKSRNKRVQIVGLELESVTTRLLR